MLPMQIALLLITVFCLFVFLVNFPDLKWVQVSSADEALKVMKLGKRNQSISSTKLNLLSSRRYKFLPGAYLF